MPEAAKISAEVFYAPGIVSWKIYLYAPYSPPNQLNAVKTSKIRPKILCKKSSPRPPFRGAGGKVLGVLTAARPSANIRDKPRPHGPGPANRRHPGGVQKGEVNVNTPSTAELLVEQAKEAERLRLKLLEVNRLAETCKDLDDFRRELDRLNKQQ